MKKFILLLFSIFLLIPISVNAIETTKQFIINIDILEDGSIKVKELAKLDGEYNGRFRTLEYKENFYSTTFSNTKSSFEENMLYNGTAIEDIKVGAIDFNGKLSFSDFDKKVDYFNEDYNAEAGDYGKYLLEDYYNGIKIQTFCPSNYKKAFYLEYVVKNVVVSHNDVSEIFWNILGDEYEENIKDFEVKVNLPKEDKNLRMWLKATKESLNGEIKNIDNKTAYIYYDFLGAYNPSTIRMMFSNDLVPYNTKKSGIDGKEYILEVEKEAAEEANAYRKKIKMQNGVIIGVSILWFIAFIITIIIYYFKYDKELVPEFNNEYMREFPNVYGPEYVEYVMEHKVSEDGFSASILNIIYKKALQVKELPDSKKDYLLIGDETKLNDLTEAELKIYDMLIKTIGNGKSVTCKEIRKYGNTESKARKLLSSYNKWKSSVLMNAKKLEIYYDGAKYKFVPILICLLSIAITLLNINFETGFVLGNMAVGFGIVGCIYVSAATKKTKKGIEEYAKWKAFKKFLKDFGRFNEKELPEIALWEKYLVYATVLGCAKEVEKAMKVKLDNMNISEYDNTSDVFINYYYMNRLIDINIASSVSNAMHQAVSSSRSSIAQSNASSSGGFGGGGSFGGGSGGGGGGGGRF